MPASNRAAVSRPRKPASYISYRANASSGIARHQYGAVREVGKCRLRLIDGPVGRLNCRLRRRSGVLAGARMYGYFGPNAIGGRRPDRGRIVGTARPFFA